MRTHSGKGPGILWPDHAVLDGWCGGPDDLAAGLALLLDREVTVGRPESVVSPCPEDLLVLQQAGGSGWRITAPGRPVAVPEGLRLRTGEALFVPRGYTARVERAGSARLFCLLIAAGPGAAEAPLGP
ncbi:hypothetical protein ACFWCB_30355 [Streptomyces sp. NPDC060048]|uniref:hypothetical protein n=1 Tax=unclassified Streptomyces TaxID=2593676 RepID=UPI00369A4E16